MVPRKTQRDIYCISRAGIFLTGLLLALFVLARPVSAAPALPVPQTLPQPDGSSFQAIAWGDEWDHGFETAEGYTIVRDDASGYWMYAAPDGAALAPARLGASTLVVGKDEPSGLPKHLRPAKSSRPKEALPHLAAPEVSTLSGPELSPTISNFGTQKLLVLLVSFANRAGTYSASAFQASFFGSGASVKSFYQQASYNKLTLSPAAESYGASNDGVIGWLKLPYDHPSDSNQSPRIVNDALAAANPYINFAAYDTNHNGSISNTELHIIVVTAGYEQAFGNAPAPYIWAHRWTLDGGGYNPVLDGVHIGQYTSNGGYAIFGEIHTYLSNGALVKPHMATIGVMAHELGHDLDWPDLYDTSNASFGVGSWSIMGSGSWNTTHAADMLYGDFPALPDAFSRYYQGWLTPIQASANRTYALADSASNPVALLVGSNPNQVDWDFLDHSGSGEYWLVENRNKSFFDSGLPGCGVLVWHIDESVTSSNSANGNRDHPLIELIQADGRRDLFNKVNSGDAGDPYPGSSGNIKLSSGTTPTMNNYGGAPADSTLNMLSPNCASSMTVVYNGPTQVQYKYKTYLPIGVKQ